MHRGEVGPDEYRTDLRETNQGHLRALKGYPMHSLVETPLSQKTVREPSAIDNPLSLPHHGGPIHVCTGNNNFLSGVGKAGAARALGERPPDAVGGRTTLSSSPAGVTNTSVGTSGGRYSAGATSAPHEDHLSGSRSPAGYQIPPVYAPGQHPPPPALAGGGLWGL